MGDARHDAQEIETPAWAEFDGQESPPVLTDESTDDEKYAKLHVRFEERERKRYVMDNLNVDRPQFFSMAMAQFLEMKSLPEMLRRYHHNPPPPLRDNFPASVRGRVWSVSDEGQFTLKFSV